MSEAVDWNAKTIAEFRANEGRVGGNFEGAPVVLVHHRGRNSGREYVNPMMYLAHESEPDIIYVFASKAGAPTNPDWYHNLTAAGDGSVELGTETYDVTVRELTGADRDRIYAEQARRYPGFAEYERQTAGVRTIPVLELTRAACAVGLTYGPRSRTHRCDPAAAAHGELMGEEQCRRCFDQDLVAIQFVGSPISEKVEQFARVALPVRQVRPVRTPYQPIGSRRH